MPTLEELLEEIPDKRKTLDQLLADIPDKNPSLEKLLQDIPDKKPIEEISPSLNRIKPTFAGTATKLTKLIPRPTTTPFFPERLEKAGTKVKETVQKAIGEVVGEPPPSYLDEPTRNLIQLAKAGVGGAVATLAEIAPFTPSEFANYAAGDIGLPIIGGKIVEYFPKTAGFFTKQRLIGLSPEAKGKINYVVSEFKRKIGIPQERGLVQGDIRKALSEGKISQAEAARMDKTIFEELREVSRKLEKPEKPIVAPTGESRIAPVGLKPAEGGVIPPEAGKPPVLPVEPQKPVAEPSKPVLPEAAAPKEPWEMTKEEFKEHWKMKNLPAFYNEKANFYRKEYIADKYKHVDTNNFSNGLTSDIVRIFEPGKKGLAEKEALLNDSEVIKSEDMPMIYGTEGAYRSGSVTLLNYQGEKVFLFEYGNDIFGEKGDTSFISTKNMPIDEAFLIKNKIDKNIAEEYSSSGEIALQSIPPKYRDVAQSSSELSPGKDLEATLNRISIVKQALSEGKRVPAEVLKDYPELQTKIEKPPILPQSILPTIELPKPEPLALKKTSIQQIREHINKQPLSDFEKRSFQQSLDKTIAENVSENALTLSEEILRTNRPITDTEHVGMTLKATELMNDYDVSVAKGSDLIERGDLEGARLETERRTIISDQLDKLTQASDLGGREVARSLSVRRMRINREDYTIANIVKEARVVKGTRLSEKETSKLEELGKKQLEVEKKLQEALIENDKKQAEIERLAALNITKGEFAKAKAKKQFTKMDKIITERQDIKKQLVGMGLRVNDITGLTAEGSYLVGKLAVNYIKEGAVNLSEVIDSVKGDLPDITEREIYQALNARNPKAQAKARSEAVTRVSNLKIQSRLLLEIEKAEQGIFEPTKIKEQSPEPIRSLQMKLRDLRTQAYKSGIETTRLERSLRLINELQDQLTNQYRSIRKKQPIFPQDLIAAREKIKELRRQMRVEDEITKLNDQLRAGEFEIKEKPIQKPVPPELERKQIELKRLRKEIRLAISDLAPVTIKKVVQETVGTLRSLKATADMSMTFRQGMFVYARHPIASTRNFAQAVKAFFDTYTAEKIDSAIRSVDHQYIREKSGLQLTGFDEKLNQREEFFNGRWIEKIPVLGSIIRASNRHAVTFLNLQRTTAFDHFLEKYPNATQAELSAWANYTNVNTGRGDLGKAAAVATELSTVFFAPRFAASRIQTPFMIAKYWKEPRVRAEIAKSYAAFASVGATALSLAAWAGFKAGLDPRDPDFGKIRIGNTRIDLWAGIQQPMRLITLIGIAATDKAGLTGQELSEREKEFDPVEAIGRFTAFKLAPSVTIPRELTTGKTAVGEEVTPLQSLARIVTPLIFDDVYKTYQEEGTVKATLTGALAFVGIGVSTYEDRKTRTEVNIDKLLKENNMYAANEKVVEWNIRHPDKKIKLSTRIAKSRKR